MKTVPVLDCSENNQIQKSTHTPLKLSLYALLSFARYDFPTGRFLSLLCVSNTRCSKITMLFHLHFFFTRGDSSGITGKSSKMLYENVPVMKKAVAKHRSSSAVLVMDREVGLKNAARHVFPSDVLPIVHCWNHMKRDQRFKHNMGVTDQKSYYLTKLDECLKAESVEEFQNSRQETERFKTHLPRHFESCWHMILKFWYHRRCVGVCANSPGKWLCGTCK